MTVNKTCSVCEHFDRSDYSVHRENMLFSTRTINGKCKETGETRFTITSASMCPVFKLISIEKLVMKIQIEIKIWFEEMASNFAASVNSLVENRLKQYAELFTEELLTIKK
jgi:hypothetical protein